MQDRSLTDDDLSLFFLMHRAIRADLDAFAAALRTVDPTDATRIRQLERWLAFVERAITMHHEGEDEWLYVLLAERDACFAATRASLEGDHRVLEPAFTDLRARLVTLAGRTDAERDALAASARALAEHMRDHLDREERAIVAPMREHIRYAEMKEFERKGAKEASLRDLALTLPWVASAATARELELLDAVLPWPVKLLFRFWWRPSYARFASAVHAAPAVA